MPALLELQHRFAEALLGGDSTAHGDIQGNGLDPARRLAVYRNNCLAGLALALRDGFPIVTALVGEEFFDALARAFVREHPPRSGCLLDFGGDFAQFVKGYPPAEGLPYLPDMARLEWARHEAFHAADGTVLGPADLAAMQSDGSEGLRLTLHPSARLLESRWPLLRIRELCRSGEKGEAMIDLDRERGCRVLVIRPTTEVELQSLDTTEFAFLTALQEGGNLLQAFEAAANVEPDFDLTGLLTRGFGQRYFSHPTI